MSGISVTVSSPEIFLTNDHGELSVTVTNTTAELQRIVLGVFPGGQGNDVPLELAWATVDRPLRPIPPKATEQYSVTFNGENLNEGTYVVKCIAYAADQAPEEFNDAAQLVRVTVPGRGPVVKPKRMPWKLITGIALVIVAVVAAVLFLARPNTESANTVATRTFTPTPTEVIRCKPGLVYRMTRPGDTVCVTADSARQVIVDNAEVTQLKRKPNPPGGPYGINTCLQGFVWRNAYEGDQICVSGETRDRTRQENTEAVLHSLP